MKTNESRFNVYFKNDGDIYVLYYGQDTSKNFGEDDYRIKQNDKSLALAILKNVECGYTGCCSCAMCIPEKHGDTFVKAYFRTEAVSKAIKYFKEHATLSE